LYSPTALANLSVTTSDLTEGPSE